VFLKGKIIQVEFFVFIFIFILITIIIICFTQKLSEDTYFLPSII